LKSLIFDGKGYRDLPLSKAIERHAPGFENDTGAYRKTLLDAVSGKDIAMNGYFQSEREAIIDRVQKHEGWRPVKTVTAQTISVPSPKIPTIPKAPAIVEAPPIMTPMASDSSRKGLTVTVDKGDVGQDLSDRKIALIATGGLSGGYM